MRRVLLAVGLVGAAADVHPARPVSGNVHDCGAKGSGAAVDAGAGILELQPGTYRITKPIVVALDRVGFTSIAGGGGRHGDPGFAAMLTP